MAKVPEFSLFFFSADSAVQQNKYQLLLEASKFADDHGFSAVWTPERHFQRFGGLYGSPSVTGAALAVLTKRLSIRAGSVVLPLHQTSLRVAEEWSMIDNLSNGRVGLSIASGWHVNDFVLSPDTYQNRHDDMYAKLVTLQKLWRGEKMVMKNGAGVEIEVGILPAPIQKELPIWVTGKSDNTFFNAGKLGFNVLTANFALKHNLTEFVRKARIYREAIQTHHGRRGHITLMAHAFVAESPDAINKIARPALAEYIRVNIEMQEAHDAGEKGDRGFARLSAKEREILIRNQVNNDMFGPLSFVGTLDECAQKAERLTEHEVDEVACLIDFGIGIDDVMGSLRNLSTLVQSRCAVSL